MTSETTNTEIAPTHEWLIRGGSAEAVQAFTDALGLDPAIEWQMLACEQTTLVALLAGTRPKVAIEIGSRYGGSMQVLSKYADRVISVDIDPTCDERLGPRFPNVEFVTGDSRATFAPLMSRLDEECAEVGFVLIDGDHTAAGVSSDISGLRRYHPRCPMFVVMHDSFNPDVREGIRTAPWLANPYVHAVELDFAPGVLTLDPSAYREMWGGLALAVLLPTPRTNGLDVTARHEKHFRQVFAGSAHRPFDLQSIRRRVLNKGRKLMGLLGR